MSPRLYRTAVVTVLLATAAAATHLVRLRRQLLTERAVHRLTDGLHHREHQHARAAAAHADVPCAAQRAVLADADAVLDTALNHRPEGGDR